VGAEVGQVVARRGVDRRHDRHVLGALGRVGADPDGAVLAHPAERALAALLVEPAAVAQLDRDRVRAQALEQRGERVQPLVAGPEGGRELEQERGQLAGLGERLDRLEDRVAERVAQALVQLHPAAAGGLRPRAQVLRERVEWRRVAREHPVELHVERELLGRDLRPPGDRRARRDRVERRVDLDGVEALRVPRQAVAGRQVLRVPLLDEARVRPARRAHHDHRCGATRAHESRHSPVSGV
jgi:hypothetical protein